jgi:hypothetical protein
MTSPQYIGNACDNAECGVFIGLNAVHEDGRVEPIPAAIQKCHICGSESLHLVTQEEYDQEYAEDLEPEEPCPCRFCHCTMRAAVGGGVCEDCTRGVHQG